MIRRAFSMLLLGLGGAVAQPGGWEMRVVTLAPALRACLAGKPGAMVIEAWNPGPGQVTARIALPGGARQDCLVDAEGDRVQTWTPVPSAMHRPGERLRAFMLERRCVDAWRVVDERGRELGWLAYPACG